MLASKAHEDLKSVDIACLACCDAGRPDILGLAKARGRRLSNSMPVAFPSNVILNCNVKYFIPQITLQST